MGKLGESPHRWYSDKLTLSHDTDILSADDLPLNVSRETLQNTRFLKQLKTIILRRMITMFQRIEKDDPEKYAEIIKGFGGALKLGAIDDKRNSDKLVPLLRFASNQRNYTSLDEVCRLVALFGSGIDNYF